MRNLFTLFLLVVSTSVFAGWPASFTTDKSSGCPPLAVSFTDKSVSGTTSWHWDFGNGNQSTLENPSATFLKSGTYTVTLTITNGNQTDTTTKTITVFKLPVVNFTVNAPSACLNDTLTFQGNVTLGDAPIVDYGWGFGNGVASSDSSVLYSYTDTGTYSITLVVQDANGCAANETKNNYIIVHGLPIAAFTASPMVSCLDSQLVTFTNASVGSGLSYLWTFSPGQTSTLQNPTFLYTQGAFPTSLLITDVNGCQSKATKKIVVSNLVASFTASKTLICTGQPLQFSNTSNFSGTNWFWDFGDGTNSTNAGPVKIYTTPGMYTVKFVDYNYQCADSVTRTDYITVVSGFSVNNPSFSADSTTSCGTALPVNFTNTTPLPGGASISWSFGNGDTSSQANPHELYTTPGDYTVTLTITDTSGCIITVTMPDYIQTAPPLAKFIADNNSCPNSTVQFYNKSSAQYRALWNFGDGDTTTTINPAHKYKSYGNYTVALTAYSPTGCHGTTTMPNFINVDSLHVDFSVNQKFSPCPPFVVEFKNLSASNVIGRTWIFGDGYTDTAANPTHIYFYPGVYTVMLVGQGVQGCIDTMTYSNLITVQGPTGIFSVAPTTGCVPLQVNITATPSSTTQTVLCDLGDGTVVNDSLNLSHTYTAARVYHPQYVLTDHEGCTVSYPLDSITVHALPVVASGDTSVCAGTPLTVSLGSQPYTYLWSPATYLICDTCSLETITAADTVTYQITATNQFGCQSTASLQVKAAVLPVLNDTLQISLCKHDQYPLFVGNADRISWSPATYLSDPNVAEPVCTPDTSIQYTVSAYNNLGCVSTTVVPVTVKTKVEIAVAPEIQACSEGNVQLQSSLEFGSVLGVNYNWTPEQILNNPSIADPVATVGSQTDNVQLIATSGHCIPDTQTISIEVQPLPDIVVSQSVTTTPNAEVPLYAASHQELTYTWTSKDSLSCTGCDRPNAYPLTAETIYVVGVNAAGCKVSDSIQINVVGCDGNAVYLPNTFTPNGDGTNDKFYVRSNSLASLKYFRIYDSWGKTVFETENLSEGWDGNVNGKAAPMAVYVYELEGTCQNGYDVIKSGNITAIR